MQFTTTHELFLKAILIAERVVGKKESLPVLSCVVLDVGGNECVVKSTNLEAGVEVHVHAEVKEKGVIAVPVSVLSQTIRSSSGDKITLRVDQGNLRIESKGLKTVIKAVPHEEFPALPRDMSENDIVIPRESLITLFQSVSYAASSSMIRPELGSVYLSINEGALTAVATDSFRLAEKTNPFKGDVSGDVLIPLKHVHEMSHILERLTENEITLSTSDTQLSLSTNTVVFVSRVIDGTFPNYKEILPKNFSTEATLLKADFAESLRKARIFSGADQHVGFHLYPKKKVFDVTAQSAAIGEMSDSLEAAVTGEDIDVNFHIGYVADALQSIPSDSIVLGFSGAGKPLVIRGVGDSTFTYLAMPLNR